MKKRGSVVESGSTAPTLDTKLGKLVKEVVQWALVTGLLLGMSMPLLLLAVSVKSSVLVVFSILALVLALATLVMMKKTAREVTGLVKKEAKKKAT